MVSGCTFLQAVRLPRFSIIRRLNRKQAVEDERNNLL